MQQAYDMIYLLSCLFSLLWGHTVWSCSMSSGTSGLHNSLSPNRPLPVLIGVKFFHIITSCLWESKDRVMKLKVYKSS